MRKLLINHTLQRRRDYEKMKKRDDRLMDVCLKASLQDEASVNATIITFVFLDCRHPLCPVFDFNQHSRSLQIRVRYYRS